MITEASAPQKYKHLNVHAKRSIQSFPAPFKADDLLISTQDQNQKSLPDDSKTLESRNNLNQLSKTEVQTNKQDGPPQLQEEPDDIIDLDT